MAVGTRGSFGAECDPNATNPTATPSIAIAAAISRFLGGDQRDDRGDPPRRPVAPETGSTIAAQPVTETVVVPIGLVGAVGTTAEVVEWAGGTAAGFVTPAWVVPALAGAAFFSVVVADFADPTVVVTVTVPGTVVAVGVPVEVAGVVVDVDVGAQFDGVIVSESSVTAPFSAKTRPRIVTLVVTVML
jgi:hypothetical protein